LSGRRNPMITPSARALPQRHTSHSNLTRTNCRSL